jgi:GGDEF domain-containing protein
MFFLAAAAPASGTTASVSIGGAMTTAPDPRLSDDLTNAADRALYDTKREGRNRIAITATARRRREAG